MIHRFKKNYLYARIWKNYLHRKYCDKIFRVNNEKGKVTMRTSIKFTATFTWRLFRRVSYFISSWIMRRLWRHFRWWDSWRDTWNSFIEGNVTVNGGPVLVKAVNLNSHSVFQNPLVLLAQISFDFEAMDQIRIDFEE